jgi:hypothetical protein
MWIEVFRAGDHGKQGKFSIKDLQKIADVYDPSFHEAPVVKGHPDTSDPAYGWVKKLEVRGQSLWAYIDELAPSFEEDLKKGRYKHRSVRLIQIPGKGWYLDHVGFLGAVPPVVKGMTPIRFKEPELISASMGFSGETNLADELPDEPITKNWLLGVLEKFFNKKQFAQPPSFANLSLADDDVSWNWDWAKDADAIIKKYGWKGLAEACAYVDREYDAKEKEDGLPKAKAAYSLPMAKIIDGKLKLVWNGVRAAMAALMGARGGVKLKADAKKKAYNKIVEAYKRFKKEPPEFKGGEDMDNVITLTKEELERKIKGVEEEIRDQYAEEIKEKEEELKKLRAQLTKIREKEKKQKLDELFAVMEKKVPPAYREPLKTVFSALDFGKKIEFSENGEKKEYNTFNFLKEFFSKMPDAELFSEMAGGKRVPKQVSFAGKNIDEEMAVVDQKVREYAEKHGKGYIEALHELIEKGEI